MNRLIAVIIALLFSVTIYSQNEMVKWGMTQKATNKKTYNFYPIGFDGEELHIIQRTAKKRVLLGLNKNYDIISEEDLDFEYDGKELVFQEIIETKSGIFAFLSYKDYDKNKSYALCSKFQNGGFGKVKKVYSYRNSTKKEKWYNTDSNSLYLREFAISKDSSYIVYLNAANGKFNEKSSSCKIEIAVFDSEFNLVWKKKESINLPADQFGIKQLIVSNQAEVYYLFSKSSKISKTVSHDLDSNHYNTSYTLHKINQDTAWKQTIAFENGKRMYHPGIANLNGTGEIHLVGLYDKTTNRGYKGVFSIQGNIENLNRIRTHEFDKSLLLKFEKESSVAKGNGIDFRKRGVFLRNISYLHYDDNSVGLIAEEYSSKIEPTRTNTNNLIFVRISEEGELLCTKKIDKLYEGPALSYNSYFASPLDKNTAFLFNTYYKKGNIDEIKVDTRMNSSLLVLSEDGSIKKNEIITNTKEIPLYFRPEYTRVSGNKILFNLSYGNKFRLGVIDLSGL